MVFHPATLKVLDGQGFTFDEFLFRLSNGLAKAFQSAVLLPVAAEWFT